MHTFWTCRVVNKHHTVSSGKLLNPVCRYSNKLGNREKFPKLRKPFQAFTSLENLFRFPSLLLSETLRGFPNVRELILAGIREYLFFRVYQQQIHIVMNHYKIFNNQNEKNFPIH